MAQSGRAHAGPKIMDLRQPHRWRRLAIVAVFLAAVLVAAGFARFVTHVNDLAAGADASADGVVVLTGGPERIAEAVELLAAGRGRRLLITGVNPLTRVAEISNRLPQYGPMFACCVDIDRSATNTIGNAVEARRWAEARNFRSLIVVTSNYHMPRALTELAHQLPGATLIPHPVTTEHARTDEWWAHALTARTLAIEYVKYVAALVRTRLEPSPPAGDIAAVQIGNKN